MTNCRSILFICLGNICRSPAADGIMRKKAKAAGLDIFIDSAAIGAWHIGNLPDRRMRECGKRHGYTFDHHARQISPSDFDNFDVIMGMDAQNLQDLRQIAKTEENRLKIRSLASFMTNHEGQKTIPDPYYGNDADFEFALELIEDATDGLIRRLSEGKEI